MIVIIYKWSPGLASRVGTTSWNNNTEFQRAVAYVCGSQNSWEKESFD